jgi:hypothetical protein
VVLDWRNRADIIIVITDATVVSDTIVAVDSVVGVPTIISIITFIGRPDVQETSCRRVFLDRLVVLLLFQGGVVPFPGHIIVIVFIFQFPIEEELEVLAIGQGLIVL